MKGGVSGQRESRENLILLKQGKLQWLIISVNCNPIITFWKWKVRKIICSYRSGHNDCQLWMKYFVTHVTWQLRCSVIRPLLCHDPRPPPLTFCVLGIRDQRRLKLRSFVVSCLSNLSLNALKLKFLIEVRPFLFHSHKNVNSLFFPHTIKFELLMVIQNYVHQTSTTA